jgi:hypothetical protein
MEGFPILPWTLPNSNTVFSFDWKNGSIIDNFHTTSLNILQPRSVHPYSLKTFWRNQVWRMKPHHGFEDFKSGAWSPTMGSKISRVAHEAPPRVPRFREWHMKLDSQPFFSVVHLFASKKHTKLACKVGE